MESGKRVVIPRHDFRVLLEDDFREVKSSSIMTQQVVERDRLRGMISRVRQRASEWSDWLLVLALGGPALYEIWISTLFEPGITGPRLPNTLLFILMSVPFAWRRRMPVVAMFVVLVASGIQADFFTDPAVQPPFETFLALLLAFYSVGAHGEGRHGLLGAASGGAVVLATDLYDLLTGEGPGDIVPPLVFWAAAWFIGRTLRQRRLQTERLQNLSAQLEREREERAKVAVIEERSRIARELHDVIAHSVSVMVVQAQATQRLLDGEQSEARQALGFIETTGRQALVEMRRLLGVLRRTDAEPALTPQPGLGSLDALVEQFRESGLPVELRVEGEPEPLPPGVDLSAYRIVQEALTNALKHAGPARARVEIHYGDDEVALEITDDGPGNGKGGGAGQGLIGMRERVALYGGVLENGKRNGGGYLVRARLPLDPDRQ